MDDYTILRTLVGDVAQTVFSTADLDVFLQMAGFNVNPVTNSFSSGGTNLKAEHFFAASIALRALVSKAAQNIVEVKLGDYYNGSNRYQVSAMSQAADRYEEMYYKTPAWAIAETNESDLNSLITIRNYVLRTNP